MQHRIHCHHRLPSSYYRVFQSLPTLLGFTSLSSSEETHCLPCASKTQTIQSEVHSHTIHIYIITEETSTSIFRTVEPSISNSKPSCLTTIHVRTLDFDFTFSPVINANQNLKSNKVQIPNPGETPSSPSSSTTKIQTPSDSPHMSNSSSKSRSSSPSHSPSDSTSGSSDAAASSSEGEEMDMHNLPTCWYCGVELPDVPPVLMRGVPDAELSLSERAMGGVCQRSGWKTW